MTYMESSAKRKRIKWITIMVGLLMAGMMFFAAFYVTAEAYHVCLGEDCPVCMQIELLEGVLVAAGDGSVAFIFVILAAVLTILLSSGSADGFRIRTLITAKVRMNN